MTRARLVLAGVLVLVTGFLVLVRNDAPPSPQTTAAVVPTEPEVNTFSIVACDPDRQEWGIGVASKFLAVGAVVPWAKAGTGAVATQSFANTSYGPKGLELLAQGKSAEEVLKALTEEDKQKDVRQAGIVDAKGNAATFTGSKCQPWAGGKTGKHYACQGNILAGEAVVNDMAKAFEEAKGPLAWRIMAALEAAEKAGGDKRGKQSAALLIHSEEEWSDLDLRVDDHTDPLAELERLEQVSRERWVHFRPFLPTRKNPAGITDRAVIDASVQAATTGKA